MRHPIIPGTVVLDPWELAELRRRERIREPPSAASIARFRARPGVLDRVTARHRETLADAERDLAAAKPRDRAWHQRNVAAAREDLEDWLVREAQIRSALSD